MLFTNASAKDVRACAGVLCACMCGGVVCVDVRGCNSMYVVQLCVPVQHILVSVQYSTVHHSAV